MPICCIVNSAKEILQILLPYLIIKAPEARAVLEFPVLPHGGSSRWKLTPEINTQRAIIYQELKELKAKSW